MKNAQLTKKDFDNAVKQEWHSNTCIVAQCMKRNGLNPAAWPLTAYQVILTQLGSAADDAMHDFDHYFGESILTDIQKRRGLKKLRASLPIPIKLPA